MWSDAADTKCTQDKLLQRFDVRLRQWDGRPIASRGRSMYPGMGIDSQHGPRVGSGSEVQVGLASEYILLARR